MLEAIRLLGAASLQFSKFRVRRNKANDPLRPLIGEVGARLDQLAWILTRIERLEARHRRVDAAMAQGATSGLLTQKRHARQADILRAISDELWVLTEAFYFIAFRTSDAIAEHPSFKKFNPPDRGLMLCQRTDHLTGEIGLVPRARDSFSAAPPWVRLE